MKTTPTLWILLLTLLLFTADVPRGIAADATAPSRRPAQVVGVVVKRGNKKITLTWTVTDPTVTSCRIYRADYPGGVTDVPIAEIPKSDDASYSYTDRGLTNLYRYFYRITAVNDVGEAVPSLEVTATPMNPPPTIIQPAAALQALVTEKTVRISVDANDDEPETALTYSWICNSLAKVYFVPNDTHASKTTTAFFTEAGTYPLEVVVADADGGIATSTVPVTVQQAPAALTVFPVHPPVLPVGQTWCFHTIATDQFGQWMNADKVVWRVTTGKGTITRDGLYKAPPHPESDTITARLGDIEKTVTVLTSPHGSGNTLPVEPTQAMLASAKFTVDTGAWTPSTAYVGQTITSTVTGHLTPPTLDGGDMEATFVTYAWTMDGVYYSPDGKTAETLLDDKNKSRLPQGQSSTLAEFQLERPGIYHVKVTGTATVHSCLTGAVLAQLSGSGTVGENPHGMH